MPGRVLHSPASMCSSWDLQAVKDALAVADVRGKRVLEVGALDVNGSVRGDVMALGPAEYVGIDLRPGPGVDVVCDAGDLVERFGENAFDVVISTELLEHARDWRRIVSNIKRVTRPGGLMIVSTRSYGVDFHRRPWDYWRYQPDDFQAIFADVLVEDLRLDPTDPGLLVKARKPARFVERDLGDIALYSIMRRRRQRDHSRLDLLVFQCRYRLVRLLKDLAPKRHRAAIHWRFLH
jgi:SAM-dependent methyltransferase